MNPTSYTNKNFGNMVNYLIDQYKLPQELKETMNEKTKQLFVQEGMLANKITFEDVPISSLRAMQEKIYMNKLQAAIDCQENYFPILVQRYESNGKILHAIYDGHHRSLAALEKGAEKIRAIVLHVDIKPIGINWSLKNYSREAPREEFGSESPYCRKAMANWDGV